MFQKAYRLMYRDTKEYYKSNKKTMWFTRPTAKYLHITLEIWEKLEIIEIQLIPMNIQTLQVKNNFIKFSAVKDLTFEEVFTPVGYDEDGFHTFKPIGKILKIVNDMVTVEYYNKDFNYPKAELLIAGVKNSFNNISNIKLIIPSSIII